MSWDDEDSDWETDVASLNLAGKTAAAPPPAASAAFSDEEEVVDEDEGSAAVPTSKPKNANKPSTLKPKKKTQAQQKKEAEVEEERARNAKPMTDDERAQLKKQMEEDGAEMAKEMFGSTRKIDGTVDVDTITQLLGQIDLAGEQDYSALAKAVSKRLEMEDRRMRTREFIKEFLRMSTVSLTDEDVVDIGNVLSVIKNEKVKSRIGKKKKKVVKATIKMDRGLFDDVGDGGKGSAGYDDDLDFM